MKYSKLAILTLSLFILDCSENSISPDLSQDKQIESFIIESHSLIGDVNTSLNTIRIKITPETNRTNLTPTIRISNAATINPPSGLAQDFSDTLNYSVTAEDKSVANYKVHTSVGNYILNSCFHIVHMQEYFINELGIHNRNSVISATDTILHLAREENIPIVFSKSQPIGNREIIDELKPLENEKVIESTNDQPILDAIEDLKVKSVVVAGILTHACIKDICTELHTEGYKVYLVNDATSVLQNQDINLIDTTCAELEQSGIVQLISSKDICF